VNAAVAATASRIGRIFFIGILSNLASNGNDPRRH
jgi:hypothetical protein